ncbi:MAG: hypothetical protein Q8O56_03545 [Solirubrobacteraceae bacterium]|nr:hypothetical protein [Solirubrobacteraceae bacterium]
MSTPNIDQSVGLDDDGARHVARMLKRIGDAFEEVSGSGDMDDPTADLAALRAHCDLIHGATQALRQESAWLLTRAVRRANDRRLKDSRLTYEQICDALGGVNRQRVYQIKSKEPPQRTGTTQVFNGAHIDESRARDEDAAREKKQRDDAVSAYALRLAKGTYYLAGWDIEDFTGQRLPGGYPYSYDLILRRGGEVRWLESKGTTGRPSGAKSTANERAHARDHDGDVVLWVVHDVRVDRAGSAAPIASAGVVRITDPWLP